MTDHPKVVLELPFFPPSLNAYYGYRGAGKRAIKYVSAEGKSFRANVEAATFRVFNVLHGRLAVRVDLHPPDARVRDVDNYAKALLDAMKGHVFVDDRQIDRLLMVRNPKLPPRGKTVVTIWELDSDVGGQLELF